MAEMEMPKNNLTTIFKSYNDSDSSSNLHVHIDHLNAALKSIEPGEVLDIFKSENTHEAKGLFKAAETGDIEILECLFNKLSPDQILEILMTHTILHRAARNRQLKVAKFILGLIPQEQRSKLIKQKDANGNTPIQNAAKRDDLQMVKYIFESIRKDEIHELLTTKSVTGSTAIHRAARYGSHELLQYMLDAVRQDQWLELLNQEDQRKCTPIDEAQAYDKETTANLIKQCKSDAIKRKETALEKRNEEISELQARKEMEDQINKLTQTNFEQSQQIQNLSRQREEDRKWFYQQLDNLKNQLKKQTEQIKNQSTEIAELQTKIKEQGTQIEHLEVGLCNTSDKADSHGKKIGKLEHDVDYIKLSPGGEQPEED